MMRQIVLDTETTGLDPKQGHRIIEIGCVEMVNRRLTGNTFHVYINPQRLVEQEAIEVHGLRLDPISHRVTSEGNELDMGPTEFRLLHFFMTHPERVYSREQLLDHVWGTNVYVEDRTVDVHIRRLRKTLEVFAKEKLVQTVRGSGYRFSAGSEERLV